MYPEQDSLKLLKKIGFKKSKNTYNLLITGRVEISEIAIKQSTPTTICRSVICELNAVKKLLNKYIDELIKKIEEENEI